MDNSKFRPRKKVPVGPGFSQAHWLGRVRRGENLGCADAPRPVTVSELSLHNKIDDCWIALQGQVFDITQFLPYHPGGKDIIVEVAGKDVTEYYNYYHHFINARFYLARSRIGSLVPDTFDQPQDTSSSEIDDEEYANDFE
eukprot:TRINITY_DN8141_c0_g1_i1.p1 TRINITY_DN8141_c0_g1~~TRINITY_DN8141_c0_g1_i1.p1  ORF type:complete len:141 (-),score=28.58 TRINITY_DN8141_c0_g1_i1:28-450(-)